MIFRSPIRRQLRERFFTRPSECGRQYCAVEFTYESDRDNAAIINVPGGDIQFHDIFYPVFFSHLNRIFQDRIVREIKEPVAQQMQATCAVAQAGSTIQVIVPSGYYRVVPVFFSFMRSDPSKLWLPCASSDGRSVKDIVKMDHVFYTQNVRCGLWNWERSNLPALCSLELARSGIFIDERSHILRVHSRAVKENRDEVVDCEIDIQFGQENDWKKDAGIKPMEIINEQVKIRDPAGKVAGRKRRLSRRQDC